MKVQELVEKLNLKVLSGEKGLDREIDGCYISDLLSDVMGNAMEGNIWITLQTHKNVMAVASLKELACIILVKNLVPNDETIEQSNDEATQTIGELADRPSGPAALIIFLLQTAEGATFPNACV